VSAEHVERVLALARGRVAGVVALPGAWRVVREGDRLVRRAGRRPAPSAYSVPNVPGTSVCGAAGAWRMTLSPPEPAGASLPRDPSEAVFDAAQLGALCLRSRRPGDRIHLPGVGTRKLQDVLVDARVPREARDDLPLLESGSEILWVPGVARGSGASIGPQTRLVVRGLLERPGTPPGSESGGRTLPMQNSHGT
jgi:tRNA(Ile)-lysidine synthetase-like protein